MLNRPAVQEFLEGQMEDVDLEIPADIDLNSLVETFCQYTKDDFKSFFNHGNPDWEWVRERIGSIST